ncbi:hypothetical protein D3C78_1800270 [compost metagenome]
MDAPLITPDPSDRENPAPLGKSLGSGGSYTIQPMSPTQVIAVILNYEFPIIIGKQCAAA